MVDYFDQRGNRCSETFERKKDADARHSEVKVGVRKGTHTAPSRSPTVRFTVAAIHRRAKKR